MELNEITELCNIGYKYGTDKCPQIKHWYTPFYFHLLKNKRQSFKKVLEIGIGDHRKNNHTPEIIYENGISPYLQRGASLYMWRDFFPNAQIYGADINPETIFEDERIMTYICDQTKKGDIIKLVENTGSDIDLVLDNASHKTEDQIFLAKNILPLLKKKFIYIVEDVTHSKKITSALGQEYNYQVPLIPRKWHGGMILVIRSINDELK